MYQTIVVNEYKNDDAIIIQKNDLNELRKGLNSTNFIVKVHAAPIHPLDSLKLAGQIAQIKAPFTPGSEASGVIQEAKNKQLIGKKVAFTIPIGSWREYALVNEGESIIQNDDVNLDFAACGYIYPLTSQGLIYSAMKYNAKGVVNLAAGGTIGKMINDLAKENGMNCLNIIRGDEKAINQLKEEYQNENVISQDGDEVQFEKKIKEITEKLSATVCFDPIGGKISGQILNNLPMNGTLINYGSLGGKDIEGINAVQVRWGNKRLEGFAVFDWYKKQSEQDKKLCQDVIKKHTNTIFKPIIEQQFSFNQIKAALTLFRGLKGGKKILLKPYL